MNESFRIAASETRPKLIGPAVFRAAYPRTAHPPDGDLTSAYQAGVTDRFSPLSRFASVLYCKVSRVTIAVAWLDRNRLFRCRAVRCDPHRRDPPGPLRGGPLGHQAAGEVRRDRSRCHRVDRDAGRRELEGHPESHCRQPEIVGFGVRSACDRVVKASTHS